MVEAVRPFKLDHISMSYKYKVSEHLLLLWIGIWMHPHTITTIANVTPDFGEKNVFLLGDDYVQTMLLHYG
jgi:hypothetical protein